MKKVKDILKRKGSEVWTIKSTALVIEALNFMEEKGIGALVVMEGTAPVGIMSERDYARKIVLKGKSSERTQVREIMSSPVVFAQLDQNIEDCMTMMTNRFMRHLPVLNNGALVGIISIGDLVKSIIADQKSTIESLERYITG